MTFRDTGKIDLAPNTRVGTKRYMAPEVLDESLNNNSFAAFKAADIYSMGLVFWEACRRCCTGEKMSKAEPYALPYHEFVSNDPDFDDMKLIVCENKMRPLIEERWKNDPVSIFNCYLVYKLAQMINIICNLIHSVF